jgi:hypothetical protein
MKASAVLLSLPALTLAASYDPREYASGAVHERIMSRKHSQWSRDASQGKHDPKKYRSWKKYPGRGPKGHDDDVIRCKNGLAVAEAGNANQTFRCNNVCHDYLLFRISC